MSNEKENIVEELNDWAYIVDGVQGKAHVVMLSGAIFKEAADEIRRLEIALSEAYDACRYALAASPRWEALAESVVHEYEAAVADDIVTRLRGVLNAFTVEEQQDTIDKAIEEIERLHVAVDAVLKAISDKGSHPEYHYEIRRRHEREWPTLWRAIAGLTEARRG